YTALGGRDMPDPAWTEVHRVDLAFDNPPLALSQYAFHLGNASHALEDSFAHTFRTDVLHRVVGAVIYIAPHLDSSYDPALDGAGAPAVDGRPHERRMASCDDDDAAARARTAAAIDAVAQLYSALNAQGTHAERLDRAGAVLDAWLSYSPGCTGENDWC